MYAAVQPATSGDAGKHLLANFLGVAAPASVA